MYIINQYLNGGGLPVDNLIAEYLFDNNQLDTSGNDYHLDGGSVPSYSTNRHSVANSCAVFNGTNEVESTLIISASLGTISELSFSYWIKFTSTALNMRLISFGTASTGQTYCKITSRNSYNFSLGTGDASLNVQNALPLNNDLWHHVVYTVDGSTSAMNLYVDNDFVDSLPDTASFTDSAYTRFRIAGIGFQRYTGSIDDIRIYNKILSISEIAALFNE